MFVRVVFISHPYKLLLVLVNSRRQYSRLPLLEKLDDRQDIINNTYATTILLSSLKASFGAIARNPMHHLLNIRVVRM